MWVVEPPYSGKGLNLGGKAVVTTDTDQRIPQSELKNNFGNARCKRHDPGTRSDTRRGENAWGSIGRERGNSPPMKEEKNNTAPRQAPSQHQNVTVIPAYPADPGAP